MLSPIDADGRDQDTLDVIVQIGVSGETGSIRRPVDPNAVFDRADHEDSRRAFVGFEDPWRPKPKGKAGLSRAGCLAESLGGGPDCHTASQERKPSAPKLRPANSNPKFGAESG